MTEKELNELKVKKRELDQQMQINGQRLRELREKMPELIGKRLLGLISPKELAAVRQEFSDLTLEIDEYWQAEKWITAYIHEEEEALNLQKYKDERVAAFIREYEELRARFPELHEKALAEAKLPLGILKRTGAQAWSEYASAKAKLRDLANQIGAQKEINELLKEYEDIQKPG